MKARTAAVFVVASVLAWASLLALGYALLILIGGILLGFFFGCPMPGC